MQTNNHKILIVDDVSRNIQVVAQILQPEGYQISFAKDGPTALDRVKHSDFDLILLDIMMPGMDGYEVCRQLKADPRTQPIPVIFLTAKTETDDLVRGFEAGAVDYVSKPFNGTELLARVQTQLRLRESEKERLKKEKLKSILEIAGAVCHELHQPMQSIMGYSELLLAQVSEESPIYSKLRIINQEVNRMSEITQKLMRITRYRTKSYLQDTEIFDIHEAIEVEQKEEVHDGS